jgi:hypothetical protein
MVFIVVLLLQLIFAAADQLTQEPESQLLIFVAKKEKGKNRNPQVFSIKRSLYL